MTAGNRWWRGKGAGGTAAAVLAAAWDKNHVASTGTVTQVVSKTGGPPRARF